MAETGASRTGGGGAKTLVMLGAFLFIGGFLYWLNISARAATEVAIAEDGSGADEEEDAGIPTVVIAEFSLNPRQFEGQEIRMRNIPVSSTLGPEAFWFTLENQNPYLVKLDSALVADGQTVESGDRIRRLVGTVHPMSDSVLNAWEAAGAFTNETHRIEAEFATTFMQARRVELRAPTGQGSEGGGGG